MVELLRIGQVDIMFAFREDIQPRAGDAVLEHVCMKTRHQRIFTAVQDQRRAADQVQALTAQLASGLVERLHGVTPARPQVLQFITINRAHGLDHAGRPGRQKPRLLVCCEVFGGQIGVATPNNELRDLLGPVQGE